MRGTCKKRIAPTAGESLTLLRFLLLAVATREFLSNTGLGAEYGLDEGKARRHRAFYVIDRSVPVAYQEGQDMNTEN